MYIKTKAEATRQKGQTLRAESEVMSAKGFKKDGEPVWDQVTIDRLWVTTQREAMIESGPSAAKPAHATDSKEQSEKEKTQQKDKQEKDG